MNAKDAASWVSTLIGFVRQLVSANIYVVASSCHDSCETACPPCIFLHGTTLACHSCVYRIKISHGVLGLLSLKPSRVFAALSRNRLKMYGHQKLVVRSYTEYTKQ